MEKICHEKRFRDPSPRHHFATKRLKQSDSEENKNVASGVFDALCQHRKMRLKQVEASSYPTTLTRAMEGIGSSIQANHTHHPVTHPDHTSVAVPELEAIRGGTEYNPSSVRLDLETHAASTATDCPHTSPAKDTYTQIEPPHIASLFAVAAAKTLSREEFNLLLTFLAKPTLTTNDDHDAAVSTKLNEFVEAELLLTNLPKDRLATPSGPNEAELGILLHCQSKEGKIGNFWDVENSTIQSLVAKGLSEDFVFGFDWHWRAEESARRPGKSSCPALMWPEAQRKMHDAASLMLLDLQSLPWLIIGGRCAKAGYQISLTSQARQISVPLLHNVSLLFEIDYRASMIRRITAYIPHPASAFFHPKIATDYSVILDATIGFFLWVVGRHSVNDFFTKSAAVLVKGIPGAAPLKELYGYRTHEAKCERKLVLEEYNPSFLGWVANYLGRHPSEVLGEGKSLAQEVIAKIGQAISASAKKRRRSSLPSLGLAQAGRKSAANRYGHTFRRFWNGQHVRITQKGQFSLFFSETEAKMQMKGGKSLYDRIKGSARPVIIQFGAAEVVLRQGDHTVFRQKYDDITDAKERAKWIAQARLELTSIKHTSEVTRTESNPDRETLCSKSQIDQR